MKKISGLIFLFLLTCTMPVFAQLNRQAVFPRFASGNGWTSEFYFSNQGIMAFDITVNFYDQNGSDLSVDTNIGTGSSFTFTLNGGASKAIHVDSSGAFKEGYVVADYPIYYAPIRGTQNYRYEQNGTVQVEVGIPQQDYCQNFSFPVVVNSSKHIYTAVGLSKPAIFTPEDESIVVSLIRPDGSVQATKAVPMKAGQHLAGYVDQDWLFPGLNDFEGTISVSSPSGVSVFTLRQDKEAFGAISTDRGPMVGAFALTEPLVTETEPNDEEPQAQALSGSVIIQGNIESDYSWDLFSITGKAGDIVTVIGDTTQVSTYLDPIIGLFNIVNDDRNWIAINDDNAIAPDEYTPVDAYIQVELPTDGTYYIAIQDSYVYGGTDFYYNLHINIKRP